MIAGCEAELARGADLAHELVVRSRRGAGVRQVRQGRQRAAQLLFDAGQLPLELLHARGDGPHRRDLALALGRVGGRADARVGLVLLRAQALELRQQGTSGRVESDHLLEPGNGVFAAAGQGGTHAVGVLADALEVEHAASDASAAYLSAWVISVAGTCWASRPEYFARNSATACACSPTTMFCGMIAPEKPPFRSA